MMVVKVVMKLVMKLVVNVVVNVVVKVMLRLAVGMIEFKVFLGFCFKTDERTDRHLQSLSRLKKQAEKHRRCQEA